MKERDDAALKALSKLRRKSQDNPTLVNEYLEIKASILLENTFAREHFPNLTGFKLHAAQVCVSYCGGEIEAYFITVLLLLHQLGTL